MNHGSKCSSFTLIFRLDFGGITLFILFSENVYKKLIQFYNPLLCNRTTQFNIFGLIINHAK